jgi:hypothetical protein
MRVNRRSATACAIAAVIGTGGCFAVANLDRFHTAEGTDGGGVEASTEAANAVDNPALPSTLSLTLLNFGYHLNQLIEFRVIDNQNSIISRGFIEPLDKPGTLRVTVTDPKAIPTQNGPFRLDFYADMNDSGGYDGIGNVLTQDHAWRIQPLADYPPAAFPHVANEVQVIYEHNTNFTDIDTWPSGGARNPPRDTGLAARVRIDGSSVSQWKGKLLQMRIAEVVGGHTVGLLRIPEITGTEGSYVLPGVLDPGVDYYLDVYIDANGDGMYQNPAATSSSADLGWQIAFRANPVAMEAGAGGDAGDGGAVQAATTATTRNDTDPNEPLGLDYGFNALTDPNANNVDVGPP